MPRSRRSSGASGTNRRPRWLPPFLSGRHLLLPLLLLCYLVPLFVSFPRPLIPSCALDIVALPLLRQSERAPRRGLLLAICFASLSVTGSFEFRPRGARESPRIECAILKKQKNDTERFRPVQCQRTSPVSSRARWQRPWLIAAQVSLMQTALWKTRRLQRRTPSLRMFQPRRILFSPIVVVFLFRSLRFLSPMFSLSLPHLISWVLGFVPACFPLSRLIIRRLSPHGYSAQRSLNHETWSLRPRRPFFFN